MTQLFLCGYYYADTNKYFIKKVKSCIENKKIQILLNLKGNIKYE